MDKDFTLKLQSQTSDGGRVLFTPGNYGEITIKISSFAFADPNTPRTDARVKIKEFIEVAKAIEGIYNDYLKT